MLNALGFMAFQGEPDGIFPEISGFVCGFYATKTLRK